MTREEAIEYNKNLRMYMKLSDKNQPYKFLEENYIALDMAIKALEHPERNVVEVVPCGDTISRQAVLDINESHHGQMPNEVNHQIWEEIKALPSVAPAGKQEPCGDAISRQAALALTDELKDDLPDDDRLSDMVMSHNEGILEYQTKLSLLPSVTPAEKVGRWIDILNSRGTVIALRCSRCEKSPKHAIKSEFCPNCGAKMQEVE